MSVINSFKEAKMVTIVFVAIVVWASLIRFWGLGPQSLWIDEGYSINAALAAIDKGIPVLDSGALYLGGIASVYAEALSVEIFGLNPFSPWPARLPAALAGSLAVLLIFFLAKEYTSKIGVAIPAAFLMGFLDWSIAWSRQARGYMLLILFGMAAALFLERYARTGRLSNVVGAVVSIALATLSHPVGLVLVIPFLLVLCNIAFRSKPFTMAVSALLTCIVIAVVPIVTTLDTSLYKINYLRDLPAFMLVVFIAGIIGISLALWRWPGRGEHISRLTVFAVVPIFAVIFMSPVSHLRYFLPALPFFVVAISLGIGVLSDLLSNGKVGRFIASILMLCAFVPIMTFLPRSEYRLEPGSPQPDFKSAFQFIKTEKAPDDIVISPYAQLHKVYLGEKGMWLAMKLVDKPYEIERRIVGDVDYYVGAPVINNLEDLRAVIGSKNGFIIIDRMAEVRLPEIASYLKKEPNIKVAFERGGDANGDRIVIYKF